MDKARILIVEDEAIVALDLKLQLQDLGYEVVGIAASGEHAVAAAARLAPHLILMDVRLQGGMDGVDAAAIIGKQIIGDQIIGKQHGVPVIYLTSHSDADTVRRAAQTGPYGYLTKPYQIKELHAGLEVALTKSRMERQLRESDRWFAHTLHCVADGVVVVDLQAKVKFMNPAAERLTGWSSADAAGVDVGDVVHLRDRDDTSAATMSVPDARRHVDRVLHDGRPQPVAHALALIARDGAVRVVDQTAGLVEGDHGLRLGAVLVLRDAGVRLQQEERLRSSEARFRDAFDHAPLGMALVAFDGSFLQVNDALCQFLGLKREQLKTLNHHHLTWATDREHERQRLLDLGTGSASVVQFEKRYHRVQQGPSDDAAPADTVWALVSVSLLRDATEATCYLYQVHDLTQAKVAAERMAALADERMRREASELANVSKEAFLSRVSHEMRTPLNAVLGFSQLLKLQSVDNKVDNVGRYADFIKGAGEHLLSLVTDLLDLNRAGQGTLNLVLEPVVLTEAVSDTLRLIEGLALEHHVRIEAQVPADLSVVADPKRLRQVLLNLGSNAVKYNRSGGTVHWRADSSASVTASVTASGTASGSVTLTLHDTGWGMTPAQIQRLFQPFERLGAEHTTIPGTGLGLVIARSLLEEMGGSLAVQSTPGQGTEVTVTLRQAG